MALGILVATFYAAAFAVLTYPRIRQFSTYFWADAGDGFENVWNLWWVRKAIVDLHQSPWHTTYLDYPFGISLHAHALGMFNGLLGIPLSTFLDPVATYNAIILVAFVTSGLTAFYLAHAVTGSIPASLLAGYAFTFSGFHFAHTGAHLNVVALQWLPVYLLCWLRLLERPTSGAAVAAALTLFGVYLCDYYYFAFALLASLLFAAWEARRRRDWLFVVRNDHRRALVVFGATVAATSGVLLVAAVRAYLASPFVGAHDPRGLSLDLLAPFVPGGHSRYAPHTAWFWGSVGGNLNENSVYVGYAAVALVACASLGGGGRTVGRWYGLLALFVVLALGPRLVVFGRAIPGVVLPYAWIDAMVPLLRLGGVPIRAFAMATLAIAVLSAAGFRALLERGAAARALAVVLAAVLVVETLPGPIPASAPPPPRFADYFSAQPGPSAYIEVADPPMPLGLALYYQTLHQHPMAFGHTSRKTRAVQTGEQRLRALVAAADYRALYCDYGFRWVLADDRLALDASSASVELWEPHRRGRIYDLQSRFGACGLGVTTDPSSARGAPAPR